MKTFAIAAILAVATINQAGLALAALPSQHLDGWRNEVILEAPRQGAHTTRSFAH